MKDATAESKAELEANFAKAAVQEKMEQQRDSQVMRTEPVKVTVSSIGRRLPPKPAWRKSDEEVTMANQLTAAAFAEVPKGSK